MTTVRVIITLGLAIACLGTAIPYGTASGGIVLLLNPLEWGLSALAALACLGLVLDLLHPWGERHRVPGAVWGARLHTSGFAFMVAGAVWAALTAYVCLLPGEFTVAWRLGHALENAGWAVLALSAWRWIAVGTRRRRAA
jgi:hypothetical protein